MFGLSKPSQLLARRYVTGMMSSTVGPAYFGYEVVTAPRQQLGATAIGAGTGLASYGAMSLAGRLGLSAVARITGIAAFPLLPLGISLVAATAAIYPAMAVERLVSRQVRTLSEFGLRMRHLEMGGNFQDTPIAQGMRQQAALELTGAVLPARRLLGQESRFLHR